MPLNLQMQATMMNLGLNRGEASPYTRTAFLASSGNDATAELNNPALPFDTVAAAIAALAATVGVQSSTISLLTNISGGIAASADWRTLLSNGCTLKSFDTQRTLSGTVTLGGGDHDTEDVNLSLENIVISAVEEKSPHSQMRSIGAITGAADAIIDNLNIQGNAAGSEGGGGGNGGSETGAAGGNGGAGDPPSAGGDGQTVTASGGNGSDGGAGCSGYSLTLNGPSLGDFTVSTLNAIGRNGGAGGSGGSGGTATGGAGGIGGDAIGTDQDGGAGGAGGSAYADGGTGGNGGNGGSGGIITVTGNVLISNLSVSKGLGGAAGLAGGTGTATAGAGGAGGAPTGSGAPGATGANGSASNAAGTDGAPGNDGTAGGLA